MSKQPTQHAPRTVAEQSLGYLASVMPFNDHLVSIYGAQGKGELLVGDVVYMDCNPTTPPPKGFDKDGLAWYEVVMADTKEISTQYYGRKAPYLLFVQMVRIEDPYRLQSLRKGYRPTP